MNEVARCSNCHEFYDNTMEGLHDHFYGDNPYARNCQEVRSNTLEVSNWANSNFIMRLFKTPKLTHTALEELLDHKQKVNAELLKDAVRNVKNDLL